MCRQKVHRSHVLLIWKVKERKYVAPSVYLLAWQTEIIANPIQLGFRIFCRIWIYRSPMNATSKYIARSPFRREKEFHFHYDY